MLIKKGLFTRAQLKLIWLKHAWVFHFSHHPLCQRFALNVFHWGQLHVCRSCVCLYLGVLSGFFLSWSIGQSNTIPNAILVLTAFVFTIVLILSFPALYAHCSRGLRDALRYLTGAFASGFLMQLLLGQFWVGLSGLLLLLAALAIYVPIRRKKAKSSCDGCAELNGEQVCSGYKLQAKRLSAYEHEATMYVLKVNGIDTDER